MDMITQHDRGMALSFTANRRAKDRLVRELDERTVVAQLALMELVRDMAVDREEFQRLLLAARELVKDGIVTLV